MTDTDQTTELIRALAERFVARPDALRVSRQEAEGGDCLWMLEGAREDGGRLMGKDGSHAAALGLIVAELGRAAGRTYTFKAVLPPRPDRAAPRAGPRQVTSYDPGTVVDLLTRVVAALDVGTFLVAVGTGRGPLHLLTYKFTIRVTDARDFRALRVPRPGAPGSVVGALGTILRAIARQDGVRFEELTVDRP